MNLFLNKNNVVSVMMASLTVNVNATACTEYRQQTFLFYSTQGASRDVVMWGLAIEQDSHFNQTTEPDMHTKSALMVAARSGPTCDLDALFHPSG